MHKRLAAGPSSSGQRVLLPEGRSRELFRGGICQEGLRLQRFLEREVQVNRAPGRADGQGDRPSRKPSEMTERRFVQTGGLHLEESPGEGPEQAELIDGLIAVSVPEAVGPVGGQGQERHLPLGRFDDGRVEVRRCGTGRGDDNGRTPRSLSDPQGEEARRAFIEDGEHPEPSVPDRRKHEGSRTGARGHADLPDPDSSQLVNESLGPDRVPVLLGS